MDPPPASGQGSKALILWVAIAVVLAIAVFRPHVVKGRRTTELHIGTWFKAVLQDDANPVSKP